MDFYSFLDEEDDDPPNVAPKPSDPQSPSGDESQTCGIQ